MPWSQFWVELLQSLIIVVAVLTLTISVLWVIYKRILK